MFRCVFVYVFCLSHLTLAQRNVSTDRHDSLVRAVKASSSDTLTIKLYHLLAAQVAESNPKQVLYYEDSALAIAKRIKSEKFIAITLTNIGSHYRKISEFQKSYSYLLEAMKASPPSVRSHNLIEQRRKLREKFSKEMVLQPQNISLPGRDATFLTNLLTLLEKNYAEPEFTVDELSDEVNMSRMQLHRKLKALTDQSPGEFLRKFRLERAKQLLSIEGTQVSEACFKVGFNNVSHFSKSFREFAGVTPTEFIESIALKK